MMLTQLLNVLFAMVIVKNRHRIHRRHQTHGAVRVRTDSGTTRAGIAPAVPDTRTGTAGAGEDMQG